MKKAKKPQSLLLSNKSEAYIVVHWIRPWNAGQVVSKCSSNQWQGSKTLLKFAHILFCKGKIRKEKKNNNVTKLINSKQKMRERKWKLRRGHAVRMYQMHHQRTRASRKMGLEGQESRRSEADHFGQARFHFVFSSSVCKNVHGQTDSL